MKYNKGFTFKITKNGIIGTIDGVSPITSKETIYGVTFNDNGRLDHFDVYESTISRNIETGKYEEV